MKQTLRSKCIIEARLESEIVIGHIEKDRFNNYHCKNTILNYTHIKDNGYKEGDEIRILKSAINENEKTIHLFPKSAIRSERL